MNPLKIQPGQDRKPVEGAQPGDLGRDMRDRASEALLGQRVSGARSGACWGEVRKQTPTGVLVSTEMRVGRKCSEALRA